MKKFIAIIVIALVCTLIYAKKTIWTQYNIVTLSPDSLVKVRADIEIWGDFWLISSDTGDTGNISPLTIIIDSIVVNDYLHSTDDVQFDSTLTVEGNADFNDDVTIDSTLTVEKKAVFNDTVMLGDSVDKIILPKGSAIELYDTTDTDKFEIYDDGTHSVFASVNPFTINHDLYTTGSKYHYFVDATGADTSWIVNNGNYFYFGGNNTLYLSSILMTTENIVSIVDANILEWQGYQWRLDSDNDDAIAYISFHSEDSIKVDTTGATGHRLSWTGAGGMEIRDGTGADTSRWYDDGSSTIFETDNDFVLSDDVTLGDTINTVFLPKGTRLILADSSGADSTTFHNDGTELKISSDNRITLDGDNLWLGIGDTLIISTTTDTFYLFGSAGKVCLEGVGSFYVYPALRLLGDANYFRTQCPEWYIDSDGDDSLGLIQWFTIDSLRADTISHILEWTGSGGVKSVDGFWTEDTMFFTDGGADTSYIVQDGTHLNFSGDNIFYFNNALELIGSVTGLGDAAYFNWKGYQWFIDSDNDDAMAFISFHNEDSIKVDTTAHELEWTGDGGFKLNNGAILTNPHADSLIVTEKYTKFNGNVLVDDTLTVTHWVGGSMIRGSDAFGSEKTADTVVISGATASDYYWVTATSAPAGYWSVVAKIDSLIVNSTGSEASTSYNWLRMR